MPRSKAEVRAAHATLEGADTGMSKAYAHEVVSKMHGHHMSELPDHTNKKHRRLLQSFRNRIGQRHAIVAHNDRPPMTGRV